MAFARAAALKEQLPSDRRNNTAAWSWGYRVLYCCAWCSIACSSRTHASSQTHDRAPGLAAPARSDQCGWGRVLGGVHFRQATINADYLCAPIGKAAYQRAANLRDGTSADHVDIATFL